MSRKPHDLKSLVSEYRNIARRAQIGGLHGTDTRAWKKLRTRLEADGAWTDDGAKVLAHLARNYGSFVLRNACALAIALAIEDGRKGL